MTLSFETGDIDVFNARLNRALKTADRDPHKIVDIIREAAAYCEDRMPLGGDTAFNNATATIMQGAYALKALAKDKS